MKKQETSAGFTLLEILLAIFIFGIIMATIFGSFGYVFSSAETINNGLDSYEIASNCLNRMVADLKSIYISQHPEYSISRPNDPPNAYRFFGDISSAGEASFSRLRFASFAHLPLEKSTQDGIAEIVYYVQHTTEYDDKDNYILRRADSLYPYDRYDGENFEEKSTDPALCENVKSLEFVYYDHEEKEYDQWNSESDEFKYATPRAIKIKLEIGEIEEDSPSLFFETMVDFTVFREEIK